MYPLIESVDASIKWPFKWTLVGSSGSGKTNFAINMIKESDRLFDQKPDRVIIIYKVFQEIYNTCKKYFPTSFYTEDECDLEELTLLNKDKLLIICDDLYFSKKLAEISEHFLIKGRHRNTSWIVLTQSIFNQPALKNISRNSTHMTLFKNVRLNEPHILFSQLRPKSSKVLQNIYADATKNPYGYLDIDLSQTCPDKLRYKTNLFDSAVKVFVIMSDSSFKTMYLVNKYFLDDQNRFKLSIQNKDICNDGVNVTVKPVKRRKSRQSKYENNSIYLDEEDDTEKVVNGVEKEQRHSGDSGDDGDEQKNTYIEQENSDTSKEVTPPSNQEFHTYSGTAWRSPEQDLNRSMYAENLSLKRKQNKLLDADENTKKRARIQNQTSQLTEKTLKKIKRYPLNKFQKRIKKRQLNGLMSKTSQQDKKESISDLENTEYENNDKDINDNDHSTKVFSSDNGMDKNEAEIHENFAPFVPAQNEELADPRNLSMTKRQRIEDKSDDQWISGLKSRLNDRRVQFKRKSDTIGYRVLPVDESKSIIKPSDFKFLDPVTSSELLGKWKSLKELKRKQRVAKRLKPTRSFAVWKELDK